MRKILFFLLLPLLVQAATELPIKSDPLKDLETLTVSLERLVEKQKALRKVLEEYLLLREAYLVDTSNRDLALKTAEKAKIALAEIKEESLTYLFDPSFLSEMTLFAKLADKPRIPKP